jgi:hypothetical protein
MQFVWAWLDGHDGGIDGPFEPGSNGNEADLLNSPSWWEDLVKAICEREGRLNMQ